MEFEDDSVVGVVLAVVEFDVEGAGLGEIVHLKIGFSLFLVGFGGDEIHFFTVLLVFIVELVYHFFLLIQVEI